MTDSTMIWVVDASNIKTETYNSKGILVKSQNMDSFITDDSVRIIAATKGFGKTYGLKLKSIRIRNEKKGAIFVPRTSLVDQFRKDQLPNISDKKIDAYKQEIEHIKLWSTVFYLTIIKNTHLKEKLEELYSEFGCLQNIIKERRTSTVSGLYGILLNDYALFREIHDSGAYNEISTICSEDLEVPIYIFIDNVDEFFINLFENDYDDSLWMSSQVSLIKSIYDVIKLDHVHIYSTIRKKVMDKISQDPTDAMSQQYNGLVQDLRYTKNELREMFINNIKLENENKLIFPELRTTNPLKAFLGIEFITNTWLNIEEDIFNYILRHTFERPRDLMEMGKELASYDTAERYKELRNIINKIAASIGQEYIAEIDNFFPEINFSYLYKIIDRNKLRIEELKKICCKHDTGTDNCMKCNTHLFCALYSQGLIGFEADDIHNGTRIIEFKIPGALPIYDFKEKLPKSNRYYLQPCFAEMINRKRREKSLDFYNDTSQLVARNVPLIHSKKKVNKRIHVHFGAGNLGLGLAIENFLDKNKIIIIQRPNEKTSGLKEEYINIEASNFNKIFLSSLKVIKKVINDDDICSREHILFISNQTNDINKILKKADSISCAVGPKGMKELFLRYFKDLEFEKPINFYPFENDITSIDDFFKHITSKKLIRIGVMADRICTDVKYMSNKITLKAEEKNYQTVIEETNSNVRIEVTDTDKLRTTQIVPSDLYPFAKDKKFAIVNGTHTLLSVLSYKYLQDIGWSIEEAEEVPVEAILTPDTKQKLNDFIKLQILRVFLKYSDDKNAEKNIKTYAELLEYGHTIYERLVESSRIDKLGRILDLHNHEKRVSKIMDRLLPIFPIIFKNRERLEEMLSFYDEKEELQRLVDVALNLNKNLILSMLYEIEEKNRKLNAKIILERYGAVLFDMDGLLIDSEKLAYDLLGIACAKLKIKAPRYEDYIECIGVTKNRRNFSLSELYKHEIDRESFNNLIDIWDEEYKRAILDNTPIKNDANEILQFIKNRYPNLKIGLVTSTHTKTAEAIIKKIHFDVFFDIIIGGDRVEEGKPNPDIYKLAAEELKVDSCRCLVFEDSKNGILSANNANMDVVHIEDFIKIDENIIHKKVLASFSSLKEAYGSIIT